MGEDHRLFMCLDDLTIMFFTMCEGQRELGEPRMPRGYLTPGERDSQLLKSLTETVQKLEKQEGCPDIKFGRVYPVCLSNDMFHLNLAFPLEGPEVTAPIPRPPTRERGQVERTSTGSYSLTTMTAKPDLEPEVPEVVEIDDEEEDDEPEFNFGLATWIMSLLRIGHHLSSPLEWINPNRLVTLQLHSPGYMMNIEKEQVLTQKTTLEKPEGGSLRSLGIALTMKFWQAWPS